MNNKLEIFGFNIEIKTIMIISIILFTLFLLSRGEFFTNSEKKKCSDITPGECTSALCSEVSFCGTTRNPDTGKCSCTNKLTDDE